MLGVLFAPTAVFRDIQSVWIVFLVLHGCVIATFAIATSQGEYDSIVFLRHVLKPLALLFFWTEYRRRAQTKKTPCQVSNMHFTDSYLCVSTKGFILKGI
jgi:hypothetical protein